jgi:hypothetical protein
MSNKRGVPATIGPCGWMSASWVLSRTSTIRSLAAVLGSSMSPTTKNNRSNSCSAVALVPQATLSVAPQARW